MIRRRPRSRLLAGKRKQGYEFASSIRVSVSTAKSRKRSRLRRALSFIGTKRIGHVSVLVTFLLLLVLKQQVKLWWHLHKVAIPLEVAFVHGDRIYTSRKTTTFFLLPPIETSRKPDYGGLSIVSLNKLLTSSSSSHQRHIIKDDALHYHRERKWLLREIDEDLDFEYYRNDELDYPQRCIRPNWVWNYYPVCTNFHELSIKESLTGSPRKSSSSSIRYLNHGASREAWLIEPASHVNHRDDETFPFVLKTMISDYDFDEWSLRRIYIEALILERLSASDRTTDIYGHCGSSIMVEYASDITELIVPNQDRPQISQRALAKLQQHDVHPMNNFTAEEKLELAIAMAEGIAELHGYKGGVIVNSDIHPEQWVRSIVDGKVKLNDFNNGFFLEWNPKTKEYCSSYRSFGGDFHSPEEFEGDFVNEQIDVYSMGNNIHCLLTGLWQFPWLAEDEEVQDLVIAGKRDHVDPRYRTRSLIEGRLVEIMERAWIHDPEERASIFEVVHHLHETRRLHDQRRRR